MNKIYFYPSSLSYPEDWKIMPKDVDFFVLNSEVGVNECKSALEKCNRNILTNSPLALLDRYSLIPSNDFSLPKCKVLFYTKDGEWVPAQELTNVRIGITSDLLTLYLDKALRRLDYD